jgi:hypothetical protein
MTSTATGAITQEELRDIVTEAREKLARLVKHADDRRAFGKGVNPVGKEMRDIGGREGLFSLIRLAQLDGNGDGNIGAEEVAQFEILAQQLIEQYLGLFASEGVVTALIFSTMFPLAADANLEMDFSPYSYDTKTALSIAAYGMLMLV